MKHQRTITAALSALVIGALTCQAQTSVVITAFGEGGELTFSQIADATEYSIEWASSLDGPWTSTWDHLTHIPTNPSPAVTVAVPMYYRVVATVKQSSGAVQAFIEPADAVVDGAQWSVDGGVFWHNSDDTRTGLPCGEHTILFKPIAGWFAPSNQVIIVSNSMTNTATGRYVMNEPMEPD